MPDEIKQYVVGFVLAGGLQEVVLIRKNRPAWQAGRLNGIGGKIEPAEWPANAMAREFEEETGVRIHAGDWEHLCTITWPDDLARVGDGKAPAVHFFRHVWPDASSPPVRSCTDEDVVIIRLEQVHSRDDLIPNLKWLLPLAAYRADTYQAFTVRATVDDAVHPVAAKGAE